MRVCASNSLLGACCGQRCARAELASYTAHRTRWRDKVSFADVMPRFLLPDDFFEVITDLLVGFSLTQPGPKVVFGDAEEAGADFAVGGQAEAIAMAAEGFADGSDEADFPPAIGKHPAPGSGGGMIHRGWMQLESSLQSSEDFAARHDHFLKPGPSGIQRHELDESEAQILGASELGERFNLIIIDIPNDHGVYFHRMEA